MAKKIINKTTKNTSSVSAYLNSIENEAHRRDGKALQKLFKKVTAAKPVMWGTSIVGFGQYQYQRANGDIGDTIATGYAVRKSGQVLYIMLGGKAYTDILQRLGKHKLGKSCLYINRLSDVDLDVLEELIRVSLDDLRKKYDVKI